MNLEINDALIPGTKLNKADMGNVTGLEFLSKVFYISEGVMLSQIREVSGIDGSTLQNWTKRGWVANARLKKYNIDQVAHILIINMLRSCIQLDHIASVWIRSKILNAGSPKNLSPPSLSIASSERWIAPIDADEILPYSVVYCFAFLAT